VEEGGEEVLGLTQRFPLHGTKSLNSLNQGREFLLEGEWRHSGYPPKKKQRARPDRAPAIA
jgi:hypothetical protein